MWSLCVHSLHFIPWVFFFFCTIFHFGSYRHFTYKMQNLTIGLMECYDGTLTDNMNIIRKKNLLSRKATSKKEKFSFPKKKKKKNSTLLYFLFVHFFLEIKHFHNKHDFFPLHCKQRKGKQLIKFRIYFLSLPHPLSSTKQHKNKYLK